MRILTLVFLFISLSTVKADPKSFKSKINIEFIFIPAGEFIMGCNEGDVSCQEGDRPAHKVKITKGFYMGKYEVTQAQWKKVMLVNPSEYQSCGMNCPVENVSWDEVHDFLRVLNEKEGRTEYNKFRLPSDAEWEYSARGGIQENAPIKKLGSYAWYHLNSDYKTHSVGKKKPNAFGLYDMFGNVWEWVEDSFEEGYYAISELENPKGPTNEYRKTRVRRGGSFNSLYPVFLIYRRAIGPQELPEIYTGFRIVAPSP